MQIVARISIFIFSFTAILVFIPFFSNALDQPIGKGLAFIISTPWTLSAFADFFAGLSLSIPYMMALSNSPIEALLWTASMLCLGNPMIHLRLMIRVLTCENPKEALFPSQHTINERSFTRIIAMAYAGVILIVYSASLIYALAKESISDGYNAVVSEPWSLLLFVDVLCGVAFTGLYMSIKERNNIPVALFLITILLVSGNAITSVYVLLCLSSRDNLKESLLSTESAIFRHRQHVQLEDSE